MTESGRWLITGVTGLLGANAALAIKSESDVVGVARKPPQGTAVAFQPVNLALASSRDGLIERLDVSTVLHAAAIASIEQCESDPALARSVNVDAAADLAAQAAKSKARFIHISTDAVFDGVDGGYTEESETSPTTVYGRSKADSELAVLDANPDALVARVNFYGWSPTGERSLAEFFYSKLARRERVPGFDDVFVSTLYVGLLVEYLAELSARGASGIIHVVSGESTSKYAFGQRLAAAFGFDPDLVVPAKSAEHLSVRRGANLSLATDKLSSVLGRAPAGQSSGMSRLLEDHRAGRQLELTGFITRQETAP